MQFTDKFLAVLYAAKFLDCFQHGVQGETRRVADGPEPSGSVASRFQMRAILRSVGSA